MIISQKRIEAIRRLHLEDKREMNKSHITDEQVRAAREQIGKMSGSFLSNCQIRDVLEDAFPEPRIQELLSDEERSARHDYPQQPAAFGKLVVSEEMGEEYAELFYNTPACSDGSMKIILQNFADRHSIKNTNSLSITPFEITEQMALHVFNKMNTTTTTLREPLQSFVDAHAIKPIAFADRRPENGQDIWIYEPVTKTKTIESFECWYSMTWTDSTPWKFKHSWLPASALPIPEPAVDAKEAAWKRYELQEWDRVLAPSKTDFKAGYEAAQAGGAK